MAGPFRMERVLRPVALTFVQTMWTGPMVDVGSMESVLPMLPMPPLRRVLTTGSLSRPRRGRAVADEAAAMMREKRMVAGWWFLGGRICLVCEEFEVWKL